MKARSAIATVLALAALAACATPEGNAAAYREEALSTLKAAHSAVESVHITVGARLHDKVFGRSADDAVSLAEESLSGAAGTFGGLQPPQGADKVRDAATKLLSDAQSAVCQRSALVYRGLRPRPTAAARQQQTLAKRAPT